VDAASDHALEDFSPSARNEGFKPCSWSERTETEQWIVMQLLHSELELVVKSGFVYVPLLFDSAIAREIRDRSDTEGLPDKRAKGDLEPLVEVGGRLFVKTLNIQSLLANYESIDKVSYAQLKRAYPRTSPDSPSLQAISPNGKLHTIVFKIMPYFIRKSRGLERRRLNDEELLDLVRGKIDIPRSFMEKADKALDSAPLRRRLSDLNQLDQTMDPLQDGPIAGESLRQWFHQALEVQMVDRERVRLQQELCDRERLGESKRNHLATLLYIAEKGSFELDDFGFSRIGSRDDYFIYKRTGEYILKDYYAQSYLFPDCRVAVSTYGSYRPMVMESYKHPFLIGHAPGQEICVGGYKWPEKFTSENTIKVLEEGINALLYGYDARRRNGYHSLDPTLYYVKTIEFVDYRV
jgi:hypothetical protein